jgi:tetratricopeptide repeat protein
MEDILKLPGQIIPFVAATPPWLRVWIYFLILANCITIGGVIVYFIISSLRTPLEEFSIDTPKQGEELALGTNQGWSLAGLFPKGPETPENSATITVDVSKLPDETHIPQAGRSIIDNVNGRWQSEVKFDGLGEFEIVVSASLGGSPTFQKIHVTCVEKSLGFKNSIDQIRRLRGLGPVIERRPTDTSPAQLEALKSRVAAMQYDFFGHYERNDLKASLKTASEALDILDPILPSFPNDLQLQILEAYFLKNYGMVRRDMGQPTEAAEAFDVAAVIFESIHQQDRHDPSAWNGLGSIAMLRGDYEKALFYINQALVIAPDYKEALEDRETVLKAMAEHRRSE